MNLPTFHAIAKQLNLNVPKHIENKRAKTLTVANRSEVSIIHYNSMTYFTEVNHQNRSFEIQFAVANIRSNILGTPFFKKMIQIIHFQPNIMTYKEQHLKLPTKSHFSTFTEKDYPYISYIYTIKCKEPIHFKPRSGKTIHFPIKNYSVVNPVIHKKIEMKIQMIILLELTTVIDIIKITTPTTKTDKEITTDIEVTAKIIHKRIIDLILDKNFTIDLQVHTHLDPDMTIIIKEELHPDLHIDHHTKQLQFKI